MKRFTKTVLFASAMAILPLASAAPASAAFGISLDFGNVAVGYSDGYWDHDHHWHTWHDRRQMDYYRSHYQGSWHGYHHDRDPHGGWDDRYNNHHHDDHDYDHH